jgi:hypothetical protein
MEAKPGCETSPCVKILYGKIPKKKKDNVSE